MLANIHRRSLRVLHRKANLISAVTTNVAVAAIRNSSSFTDYDSDVDGWPRARTNTVINVCPQGEQMVVERLGKLSGVKDGGFFFAIPFIDTIQYVVDMREKALSIHPQSCITKDNVHVQVSGTLYCQFVDATKAAYGSKNPIYSVKQHAQSSMRAAIGAFTLIPYFECLCGSDLRRHRICSLNLFSNYFNTLFLLIIIFDILIINLCLGNQSR